MRSISNSVLGFLSGYKTILSEAILLIIYHYGRLSVFFSSSSLHKVVSRTQQDVQQSTSEVIASGAHVEWCSDRRWYRLLQQLSSLAVHAADWRQQALSRPPLSLRLSELWSAHTCSHYFTIAHQSLIISLGIWGNLFWTCSHACDDIGVVSFRGPNTAREPSHYKAILLANTVTTDLHWCEHSQ